jgi:hypothetical protein
MKPSEILKKARDLIITNGWTQGAYFRYGGRYFYYNKHDGSFCPMSAIYSVIDETQRGLVPTDQALVFLRRVIGRDSITLWNDIPGQTKADVITAFDKAIELAESEGS